MIWRGTSFCASGTTGPVRFSVTCARTPRSARAPILLLADTETKPIDDEHLYFVRGEENLRRANVERAATVVIVGDRRLDYTARDAKVVLSTLTVETLNPDVYSIVELASEDNVRHCERAHANESPRAPASRCWARPHRPVHRCRPP